MLDNTVRPFTETETAPPFQPSPNVSVNLIVWVQDCEKTKLVKNTKNDNKKFFIV